MNKTTYIIILFIIFSAKTNSQVYFDILSGYSFSTNPTLLSKNTIEINEEMDAYKIEIPYGKGLNIALRAGYSFNKKLSAGISLYNQPVSKYILDYPYPEVVIPTEGSYSYGVKGIFGRFIVKSKNIQVTPFLQYNHQINRMNFYLNGGVNFIHSSIDIKRKVISSNDDIHEARTLSKGKIDLGFRGTIGGKYQFGERFGLILEFYSVNTNYELAESELIQYKVNGEDLLYTFPEDETHHNYTNDEVFFDFSHIGINIGLHYCLNKSR